ncbi:YycH family regulatory protein [Brevibacillus porteri]|uniref:Transcriptional regulator n=1 Tax=Brevibacillus porteri TaxID=2126350 RepID=A0ABX5FL37_9BACL|nr:two-component system activity regulator YycH [Brevibacillus porteri]MED1799949.1 two-component system activity regulator YycH [Brevibacillus porteri]MED2132972.1 two-component system activity regulator YycH [Brevibacillus porteri]MED2744116.1 two-component system activity regulator YycH [Brevibacillus porteri]MED2816844.1 two-component system activity regulator YycH [Brevibacillus porteri]MED2894419.1 two-component system activity regulator YycH [Brevibacillus porteri]
MKRMLEPAKTVLLNLLVLASFVLTAMLWSNQPNLQFIEPAEYTQSKPVQEKQLEQLVTPESVVFHYGEDRHTKASATDAPYSLIVREMSKWIFLDFSPLTISNEKWEDIAREKMGLEVRFRSTVPLSIVGRLVTFRDEFDNRMKGIDRLWLYYEKDEDVVYALFLSTEEGRMMRSRTSISPKDLRESYLASGDLMPEQIMKIVKPERSFVDLEGPALMWSTYYLPKNQMRMQQFRYSYVPVTNDRLIESYFIDQSLVRQIMERDKTVIFTDGSRSIQLRSEQQAFTFTDPAYQQRDQELSDEEKVQSAVTFMNKHLGWLDDYHFERIKKSYNEKDLITFRQYLGAYPLISEGEAKQIDTIQITSEAGQVVTMSRSLLDLDKYIDNKEWTVMSGPELYQYIRDKKLADTEKITNAYLAYQTKVGEGYVDLMPIWVVELTNQANLYISAHTKKGGGKAHGLE